MSKMLQSAFRVQLTGGDPQISGFWASSEGGAMTREIGLAWDGGGTYDLLPGKVTAEDITITRPYDDTVDKEWLKNLRAKMAAGEVCAYGVTKYAVGTNGVTLGDEENHTNCPVRTVRTTPTAMGSEANPATIEIVLATKGPGVA